MDEHNAAVARIFTSGEVTSERYGRDADTSIGALHRTLWLHRGHLAAREAYGTVFLSQHTLAEIWGGTIARAITFVCETAHDIDKFARCLMSKFTLHTIDVERGPKYNCVTVSYAGKGEHVLSFYISNDASISSGRTLDDIYK